MTNFEAGGKDPRSSGLLTLDRLPDCPRAVLFFLALFVAALHRFLLLLHCPILFLPFLRRPILRLFLLLFVPFAFALSLPTLIIFPVDLRLGVE